MFIYVWGCHQCDIFHGGICHNEWSYSGNVDLQSRWSAWCKFLMMGVKNKVSRGLQGVSICVGCHQCDIFHGGICHNRQQYSGNVGSQGKSACMLVRSW